MRSIQTCQNSVTLRSKWLILKEKTVQMPVFLACLTAKKWAHEGSNFSAATRDQ